MKVVAGALTGLALFGAALSTPAAANGYQNWGGLYIGAHVGGAWADVDWNWIGGTGDATDRLTGGVCGPPQVAGCSFSQETDGLIGGGHVGLQHQFGNFVLGIEGSWSGMEMDAKSVSTVGAQDDTFTTDMRWLLTGTVRAGYAWDKALIYVKGGFASANIRTSVTDTIGTTGSGSSSSTHSGWTVGGGLEYALTPNIIAGLEYNYIDLESKIHTVPLVGTGPGTVTDRIDPDAIHAVMGRLSFKLGRREYHEESLK